MQDKNLVNIFDKCSSYSVMSILIMNTLQSMGRFRSVPPDHLVTKVYNCIKAKAASAKK